MLGKINRRDVLKAAAVGGAAVVLGSSGSPAFATTYLHPGMLHTTTDFGRMAAKVAAGAQPWTDGWNKLVSNAHSASSWTPNPQSTIDRGSGTPQNYSIAYNDIAAAYQNALRWKVSGDSAHAVAAVTILNAWSATLTSITGNADRFLAAGLYGYQFANAAEIMRGYSGFDLDRFKSMMLNVFYPVNHDFLTNHNGACITNYWANWDLCNLCSVLAIGILCDDSAKVTEATDYFSSGAGNGSIGHAIPFVYSGGLAQCQESGRDQGHTMLDIGLLGVFCQMAWNQGIDLFGLEDNKVLKVAEYVAKYNLGDEVPFTTYTWGSGTTCTQQSQTVISSSSRGQNIPIWALLSSHYVKLKGLSAPYTTAYAGRVSPEGGGGDYGTTSGGFDVLGFGTLAYSL
jgi:hypothetical protein